MRRSSRNRSSHQAIASSDGWASNCRISSSEGIVPASASESRRRYGQRWRGFDHRLGGCRHSRRKACVQAAHHLAHSRLGRGTRLRSRAGLTVNGPAMDRGQYSSQGRDARQAHDHEKQVASPHEFRSPLPGKPRMPHLALWYRASRREGTKVLRRGIGNLGGVPSSGEIERISL